MLLLMLLELHQWKVAVVCFRNLCA